jgi:hypothetical protein
MAATTKGTGKKTPDMDLGDSFKSNIFTLTIRTGPILNGYWNNGHFVGDTLNNTEKSFSVD